MPGHRTLYSVALHVRTVGCVRTSSRAPFGSLIELVLSSNIHIAVSSSDDAVNKRATPPIHHTSQARVQIELMRITPWQLRKQPGCRQNLKLSGFETIQGASMSGILFHSDDPDNSRSLEIRPSWAIENTNGSSSR